MLQDVPVTLCLKPRDRLTEGSQACLAFTSSFSFGINFSSCTGCLQRGSSTVCRSDMSSSSHLANPPVVPCSPPSYKSRACRAISWYCDPERSCSCCRRMSCLAARTKYFGAVLDIHKVKCKGNARDAHPAMLRPTKNQCLYHLVPISDLSGRPLGARHLDEIAGSHVVHGGPVQLGVALARTTTPSMRCMRQLFRIGQSALVAHTPNFLYKHLLTRNRTVAMLLYMRHQASVAECISTARHSCIVAAAVA